MWSNILDRVSFWSLYITIILLPLFFIPFTQVSIEVAKGLLLVVGVSLSFIFWALARFSDGRISLPKSLTLLAGFLIVVVLFFSSYFSPAPSASFFGSMLDIGTFWYMFAAFFLMLFSSIIFGSKEKSRMLLLGVLTSSAVVLLFQLFRFAAPAALSFGVFSNKLGNTVGSWNALGIFAGFSGLSSLFILAFFSISKLGKGILVGLLALSLLLVAAVNFMFIWKVLGVFALIIFVYKVSFFAARTDTGSTEKVSFPIYSFAVVMICLFFIISGQFIGSYIPTHFGVANTEIGPNLKATTSVATEVLKSDPILGLGPNMFAPSWSLYKNQGINSTVFWNVAFSTGSGLIPTFIATTGYLGIVSWALFFLLFLNTGLRSVFSSIRRGLNSELVIFFISSFFLFISSFFYFTGSVIFLLAMAFTGVFIGLFATTRENGTLSFQFLGDHRKSFFFIFVFVILLIAIAAGSFKYLERFSSTFYFNKAVKAQTIPEAEININKAASLYASDLYLRTYTQIYLIKLNSLLQKKTSALTEEEKTQIQQTFTQAENSAIMAVKFNPKNYQNFMTLGSVYGTAVAIGQKGAATNANTALNQALALNPLNPSIKLALARIAFATGKPKDAKVLAGEAVTLKPNYIDGYVVLAQLSKNEGNNRDAITYAEKALSLAPNNEALKKFVSAIKTSSVSPTIETSTEAEPTTTQ